MHGNRLVYDLEMDLDATGWFFLVFAAVAMLALACIRWYERAHGLAANLVQPTTVEQPAPQPEPPVRPRPHRQARRPGRHRTRDRSARCPTR